MDGLKYIFEWIIKKKYLSLLSVILLVVVIITTRMVINAYSGQLSAPIKRGVIVDAIYDFGTITTDRRFSFNPHVGQGIEKIFFKEGDIVKKDMPLLQTSDRVVIRAPFSGIIHLLPYKVRENTYAKEPRIVLTDISDRYVLVSMVREKGAQVKVGQKVRIRFDSLEQKNFSGKVSAISSKANHRLIRIDVTNLPETVLPGTNCNVDIVIGEHENALLIPFSSLTKGYVWVKRGSQMPRKVKVTIGVTDRLWAEVLSGDIKVGDQVMIRKK